MASLRGSVLTWRNRAAHSVLRKCDISSVCPPWRTSRAAASRMRSRSSVKASSGTLRANHPSNCSARPGSTPPSSDTNASNAASRGGRNARARSARDRTMNANPPTWNARPPRCSPRRRGTRRNGPHGPAPLIFSGGGIGLGDDVRALIIAQQARRIDELEHEVDALERRLTVLTEAPDGVPRPECLPVLDGPFDRTVPGGSGSVDGVSEPGEPLPTGRG